MLFSKPPKGTSLRRTASFDVLCGKISFEASAVASLENKKNEIIAEPDDNMHGNLHMNGKVVVKFNDVICNIGLINFN